MKIIFDYNRTIFDPEKNNLYFGVLDLLTELSKSHDLYLITRLENNRLNFINENNLNIFFQKIIYVKEKTQKEFLEIIKQDIAIIIGDRVDEEIRIGNELNQITIWIKQGIFNNLLPKNEFEKPNHTIENILDIKVIIKSYE